MRHFWIYTGLRFGLFVGSFAIVFGLWFLATGSVPVLWAIVIAFAISGVASYFLLARQREAMATGVVAPRAERAAHKLEEMRSKEDER